MTKWRITVKLQIVKVLKGASALIYTSINWSRTLNNAPRVAAE